jgi:23S rRNA (uracil1939-C5)-methyltransferase
MNERPTPVAQAPPAPATPARAPVRATQFEIELTDLAHGPFAVGRLEGQAVLVRGGVPGDRVIVRVTRRHARHLVADIVRILHPGPGRRRAPCPFHPACGGCPWQDVRYSDQLAAKVKNVRREVIRLTGGTDVVAVPAPAPSEWGYRRRIRLHVDSRRRIGFLRAQSHDAVEIDACLVAEDRLNAAIPAVRTLLRRLSTPVTECEILSRGELPGVALRIVGPHPPVRADAQEIARFLAAHPEVAGVVVLAPRFSRSWGDPRRRIAAADGEALDLAPLAFTQVNEDANHQLVASVVAAVTGVTASAEGTTSAASPGSPVRMLELHAGAGNFTRALAGVVATIHAVERSPSAAAALKQAARHLPQVTVEARAAAAAVDRLLAAGVRFDVVLADPPRQGLTDEISGLLTLRCPRLVVVSCDLATFARDARALIGGGYRLLAVDLVDLFPQTFHIELVARFELSS